MRYLIVTVSFVCSLFAPGKNIPEAIMKEFIMIPS